MLTIKTLGGFCITNDDKRLTDENLRSPMVLKLLVYIILFRDKELSNENIAAAIWQDEEIENPVGALKNLMYRLRKSLNETLGVADYIITQKGAYLWNPEIEVELDIEEFERLVNEAKSEPVAEQAITKYSEAVRLYQGEFMAKLQDMHWAVTNNTYYHSIYLTAVKSLAELCIQKKLYEELDTLCNIALKYESADEQLFCYQIEARMRCGKTALALETYEKAREIIEKELGLRKTVVLTKVYEELLAMGKNQAADDIRDIHADIVEEEPEGVFMCGYPVFKEICNLEVRRNTRSGEEAQMVLFTIETKVREPQEVMDFRIKQAMVVIEMIIRKSLRIGDVASKYSDSQFVILLANCSDESAWSVANRIVKRFYDQGTKYDSMNVIVNVTAISADTQLPN